MLHNEACLSWDDMGVGRLERRYFLHKCRVDTRALCMDRRTDIVEDRQDPGYRSLRLDQIANNLSTNT